MALNVAVSPHVKNVQCRHSTFGMIDQPVEQARQIERGNAGADPTIREFAYALGRDRAGIQAVY
jgi:hypothetical protein